MNQNQSRFDSSQKLEHDTQYQGKGEREFATVEEMLRHDIEQTVPPPELAQRVNESIAREPKPAGIWWKKLFSR